MPSATADGSVLFAKNSDRHPNEAQEVIVVEARDHAAGARVRCTYIDIPQAARTHRTLLCKPFWTWGAEMGVNEHGVAVGNESAFSKFEGAKGPGLIGLDLVRLALERATSAEEAVEIITGLVDSHPIGGNAGYRFDLFCDHAIIVADRKNAWVVEIAGREWIVEKVDRARSISNRFSTRGRGDRCSAGLVEQAKERGWCKDEHDFDFAPHCSDFLYSTFAAGSHRQKRVAEILDRGKVTIDAVFAALRDHGGADDWDPRVGITGAQVCMHASAGPVRIAHTTGSLVVSFEPGRDEPGIWVTATSTPCIGIFKPVWLDTGLPDLGPKLEGFCDRRTLWWRHELFQRAVQRDYGRRAPLFLAERDQLEAELLAKAREHAGGSAAERTAVTARGFEQASSALDRWHARIASAPRAWKPSLHSLAWLRFDREARL